MFQKGEKFDSSLRNRQDSLGGNENNSLFMTNEKKEILL